MRLRAEVIGEEALKNSDLRSPVGITARMHSQEGLFFH